MSEPWVEKHRPETWTALQGNNKTVKSIRKWLKNWKPGDGPRLLVGPPGTGKSSTAYIAAKACDAPLSSHNMSDTRTTDEVEKIAANISMSPVNHDFQIVLLDEVDSWSGRSNRKPLYEALRKAQNPIFLTANEEWKVPDPIKRASKTHKYKLGVRSRKAKLKEIAKKEGLDLDSQDLKKLATRPDLRSAINDLQHWAGTGLPPGQDGRTWEENRFNDIEKLLRGEEWGEPFNPEEMVMWADENIRTQFRGVEAALAYDTLSRADVWLGRSGPIDYRNWKFAAALCEVLPQARLTSPYDGYMRVNFPEWFRTKVPRASEETPEAALYRELSGERFEFGGGYVEFRELILPMLKENDDETLFELALEYSLSSEAVKALGLDPSEYGDWEEPEPPSEGDGLDPKQQSIADW